MTFRYRAHGLLISSAVELALPPTPPGAGPDDLTLRLGASRPVPDEPPRGTPLADLERDGVRVYSFVRDGDDRTVLRYPGLCELVGDPLLGEVTAHLDPGADPALLGVLAGGNLLAVHLLLRGHLVLHASAVSLDGRTVAFVGASGMGKSTLAAGYCAAGATLVTDDVLRVGLPDVDAGAPVTVYPGATENRLRAGAGGLIEDRDRAAVRTTADGRLALRPARRADGARRLDACVLPLVAPDVAETEVHRLRPAVALQWLMRFPKVPGWRDRESSRGTFQALGDLVEQVPVFAAKVPDGLPFRSDTLAGLWAGTAGDGPTAAGTGTDESCHLMSA